MLCLMKQFKSFPSIPSVTLFLVLGEPVSPIPMASNLKSFIHITRTEQLNKIHELLPNPMFASDATSFCQTELCVAVAS